jgi:GNAT superfamily N-acetyltransferase
LIRLCQEIDFSQIHRIINDGASAYKGAIPEDCWAEPYMSREELQHEIHAGVVFWGYDEEKGGLLGVMGIQPVLDVTLVRHAYVLTARRRQGIGARLLAHLRGLAKTPILIGTWADAHWAIRFYEKNGFELISAQEKDLLLERYWTVTPRQMDVSVVLADTRWHELNRQP